MMNHEIKKTLEASKDKPSLKRWEILKNRVKKSTIEYSKNRTSEQKIIISQLSEKVNEYEAQLPLTEEITRLWVDTKAELEERLLGRAQGIMFRSKVKWYEEGEKNTKYFYALEKAKYNAKTCYKLITDNGEITESEGILKEQHKFYTELYQEDKEVNFNMSNIYGIHVPDGIKQEQDIQLTIEDLGKATLMMQNNKTPGSDGIPVDFYKIFWKELKELFFSVVIKCFDEETLHDTAREGILNLIPKPNKDSKYIKNLRPITLLNTDYKIIERV